MKRTVLMSISLGFALAVFVRPSAGDEGHHHDSGESEMLMEQMLEMHAGHSHEHDFEAMENVTREDMLQVVTLMMDVGLALPPMDSHRGRDLFLDKGCVVCHQVNGIGGTVGPSLNAEDMPVPMNVFEFAARMWRGAPAMVQMQEQVLGNAIQLNGQELADIVAFAHDEDEQHELTAEQVPERYRELIMK